MSLRVQSFVLRGIDAVSCEIEADVEAATTAKTTVVGLPDAAVRESVERVRAAIVNAGYPYPSSARVVINLAPAHVRKEGPVYDLPIAIAILGREQVIDHGGPGRERIASALFAGELALDGRIRPVRGVISMALLARRLGRTIVVVPEANVREAAIVGGVDAIGVSHLGEVVAWLNGRHDLGPHPSIDTDGLLSSTRPGVDFGDVRGQESAKRALTVAAAGAHNILMIGPAGTGKTMMARALPGVLPVLTTDEALEVTRIYSSIGAVDSATPLVVERPVRSPHHTASSAAVIGGGTVPRPGDVTLAHRGILFLDEVPEFSRNVLETLRQPLEDGFVTIARAHGSVRFPARFMLVGALNPTPKGGSATDASSRRAMERYLDKLSGPLVDRVDLHIEVPAVPFKHLASEARGTDTSTMRDRVVTARSIQRERQGAFLNAELRGSALDRHAPLDAGGQRLLEQAMTELHLSARAYDRIRRVARTIADLEGIEVPQVGHVAEAVQYRLLDRLR